MGNHGATREQRTPKWAASKAGLGLRGRLKARHDTYSVPSVLQKRLLLGILEAYISGLLSFIFLPNGFKGHFDSATFILFYIYFSIYFSIFSKERERRLSPHAFMHYFRRKATGECYACPARLFLLPFAQLPSNLLYSVGVHLCGVRGAYQKDRLRRSASRGRRTRRETRKSKSSRSFLFWSFDNEAERQRSGKPWKNEDETQIARISLAFFACFRPGVGKEEKRKQECSAVLFSFIVVRPHVAVVQCQ
jgi:hypothetical protein